MTPAINHTATEKFRREHSPSTDDIIFTRRDFLTRTGMGFGALSLAGLFGIDLGSAIGAPTAGPLAGAPLSPRKPHFPVKAKAVIHIFASGGPSQVDTWDPKPELTQYNDK